MGWDVLIGELSMCEAAIFVLRIPRTNIDTGKETIMYICTRRMNDPRLLLYDRYT